MSSNIYSNDDFAIIISFIENFKNYFKFHHITISLLKDWLTNQIAIDEQCKNFLFNLLRRWQPNSKKINLNDLLIDFSRNYSFEDYLLFKQNGFVKSSSNLKIRLFKNLLLYQFDYNKSFKKFVDSRNENILRPKEIGADNTGVKYWFFLDINSNFLIYCDSLVKTCLNLVACKRSELCELIRHLRSNSLTLNLEAEREFKGIARYIINLLIENCYSYIFGNDENNKANKNDCGSSDEIWNDLVIERSLNASEADFPDKSYIPINDTLVDVRLNNMANFENVNTNVFISQDKTLMNNQIIDEIDSFIIEYDEPEINSLNYCNLDSEDILEKEINKDLFATIQENYTSNHNQFNDKVDSFSIKGISPENSLIDVHMNTKECLEKVGSNDMHEILLKITKNDQFNDQLDSSLIKSVMPINSLIDNNLNKQSTDDSLVIVPNDNNQYHHKYINNSISNEIEYNCTIDQNKLIFTKKTLDITYKKSEVSENYLFDNKSKSNINLIKDCENMKPLERSPKNVYVDYDYDNMSDSCEEYNPDDGSDFEYTVHSKKTKKIFTNKSGANLKKKICLNLKKKDYVFDYCDENETENEQKYIENELNVLNHMQRCFVCAIDIPDDTMIMCRRCGEWYHYSCSIPRIYYKPESYWICHHCQHIELIYSLEEKLINYPNLVEDVNFESRNNDLLKRIKNSLTKIKESNKASLIDPPPNNCNDPEIEETPTKTDIVTSTQDFDDSTESCQSITNTCESSQSRSNILEELQINPTGSKYSSDFVSSSSHSDNLAKRKRKYCYDDSDTESEESIQVSKTRSNYEIDEDYELDSADKNYSDSSLNYAPELDDLEWYKFNKSKSFSKKKNTTEFVKKKITKHTSLTDNRNKVFQLNQNKLFLNRPLGKVNSNARNNGNLKFGLQNKNIRVTRPMHRGQVIKALPPFLPNNFNNSLQRLRFNNNFNQQTLNLNGNLIIPRPARRPIVNKQLAPLRFPIPDANPLKAPSIVKDPHEIIQDVFKNIPKLRGRLQLASKNTDSCSQIQPIPNNLNRHSYRSIKPTRLSGKFPESNRFQNIFESHLPARFKASNSFHLKRDIFHQRINKSTNLMKHKTFPPFQIRKNIEKKNLNNIDINFKNQSKSNINYKNQYNFQTESKFPQSCTVIISDDENQETIEEVYFHDNEQNEEQYDYKTDEYYEESEYIDDHYYTNDNMIDYDNEDSDCMMVEENEDVADFSYFNKSDQNENICDSRENDSYQTMNATNQYYNNNMIGYVDDVYVVNDDEDIIDLT